MYHDDDYNKHQSVSGMVMGAREQDVTARCK